MEPGDVLRALELVNILVTLDVPSTATRFI